MSRLIEVVYTADDEYPDCGICDHGDGPDEFCEKACGSKYGWFGYRRTEHVEVDNETY